MFEDAPENTREKKIDKGRDVYGDEKKKSLNNSRASTSASS